MSFRKEKKYRLTLSDMAQVQNAFILKGMEELYPSRMINSCYFDTDDLVFFHESEEGVVPRKKVRIRWYNNDASRCTKETKISSIEGRYKFSESIEVLNCDNDVSKVNYFDQSYGKLSPTLIVRYERYYFSLELLRITFDRNISYKYLKSDSHLVYQDQECVMEVKVPIDCDDDYIESIIPYPRSRFSKYSRGLLFFEKTL